MYRSERILPERAIAIAVHLVTADRELLAAEGSISALRRQIEQAVASRRRNRPSYPSGASLVDALTWAQQQAYAAHEELVAADALLERPHPGNCLMMPDPPPLGTRPPADERSRRWYPAPFDPIGVFVWYLRYRPWWSTLDVAERMVHEARVGVRDRERQLDARCDPALAKEVLPPLDDALGR